MTTPMSAELLGQITSSILEEAAFFLSHRSSTPPPWPAQVLEARIAFNGSRRGVMRLTATEPFALVVAANLLGIEPDDKEASQQQKPALGELINIVCGAVVAQWLGTTQVCQLGLPEVSQRASTGSSVAPECSVSLIIEDQFRLDIDVLDLV